MSRSSLLILSRRSRRSIRSERQCFRSDVLNCSKYSMDPISIEMSSEQFENLEEDFRSLLADTNVSIKDKIPRLHGEQRKYEIREAKKNADELAVVLRGMESELKLAPASFRLEMGSRVRGYAREVEKVQRSLRQLSLDTGPIEDRFSAGGGSEFDSVESAQRQKLMQGNKALDRASAGIHRAQQISAETSAIGHEIIGELGEQRESLGRTKDKLHETDTALRRSRKILRSMARKMMTNKLVMIVIIILELAVLAGVIYWKFFT